jgi:hypothetical protein
MLMSLLGLVERGKDWLAGRIAQMFDICAKAAKRYARLLFLAVAVLGLTPSVTSRAARRAAMRTNGTPTSRPVISQSGPKGRRQTVVEGSDGRPRVQTQHPADGKHGDHWHDGKPKVDPVTGEMRRNKHGQVKDQKSGRSTEEYDE